MIVKRNRGREWLDWQRRWMTGAQYIGAGMGLLLLLALFFGEMGLPRYFSMRDHARQLEHEIQDNVWLHCPADPDLIFGSDIEDKYQRALAKIGIDLAMLSNDAGHA